MQIILEIIAEIVLSYVLNIPGAFIRWLFTGRKRPFPEVLDDDGYKNKLIGLIILIILLLCIVFTIWILEK